MYWTYIHLKVTLITLQIGYDPLILIASYDLLILIPNNPRRISSSGGLVECNFDAQSLNI